MLVAGDYYLVRSQSGDLVIQVRQFACSRAVACNKMVALRYGGSVLVFDLDDRCVMNEGRVFPIPVCSLCLVCGLLTVFMLELG